MMKNKLELIEEQEDNPEAGLKYSCSMHPITKLTIPDFMDKDRSSMIDATCTILYAMIPMMLNYLLNYASGLINIYFIGITWSKQVFVSICMGTVIANMFVFYVIEYVGAGFAIVCSYFSKNQKHEVGYLYQKTLGITFLIAVVMTPVIFLTDKFFSLFGFDHKLIQNACGYAWALVPSFYLYSFIDTNKNYLQAEGIIFPPIVIHFFGVLVHLVICLLYTVFDDPLGILGVAWAKNISNCLCALALYLYIIIMEPTKPSWVQWNLKSANNMIRFLRQVFHHQSYTYTELMAFQILCIIACHMQINEISAHFAFAIFYNVVYFIFTSLSQCVSRAVAISIQENESLLCRKKISIGALLAFLLSAILIINIIHYRISFIQIFIEDPDVVAQMQGIIYLFCAIILASSLNMVMLGVVKTMELRLSWNYSFVFCYLIGIVVGVLLCYQQGFGLWGIWAGWLLSLGIELYLNLKRILCLDFDEAIFEIRQRYKVVKEDIRASKMEITYQNEVQHKI